MQKIGAGMRFMEKAGPLCEKDRPFSRDGSGR